MIHKRYRLTCTNCGREYKEFGESAREVRAYARQYRWLYIKVPNGSYWDICPVCRDKEEFRDVGDKNRKMQNRRNKQLDKI